MDLEYNIVAYIDILGFTNMVKSDCLEMSKTKHFEKLRESYTFIKEKIKGENVHITQFSDSIVIFSSLNQENSINTINLALNAQSSLFKQHILVRGGISFGKHYSENDFIFSDGLINAYLLETSIAKNPRVVIANDLLELFDLKRKLLESNVIIKEDDGTFFLNYLLSIEKKDFVSTMTEVDGKGEKDYSVLEKMRWVYEYAEYIYSDSTVNIMKRFN